jgi:hypothetical protein
MIGLPSLQARVTVAGVAGTHVAGGRDGLALSPFVPAPGHRGRLRQAVFVLIVPPVLWLLSLLLLGHLCSALHEAFAITAGT